VIGESEQVKGFYNAVGYSGHGYMLAPATGEVMAEIILEGKSKSVNIDHLSMTRFKDGNFEMEHNVV
ncbi:MAG TPA: FAD-binding oxidoreductase, partial [Firmicutes bacterium]|nr:FAD-binding oxidoreductase [Bacillota bacterium]